MLAAGAASGPIGHDGAHRAQIVGRQPRDLVGMRRHHLSDDARRHAEAAGDTGHGNRRLFGLRRLVAEFVGHAVDADCGLIAREFLVSRREHDEAGGCAARPGRNDGGELRPADQTGELDRFGEAAAG